LMPNNKSINSFYYLQLNTFFKEVSMQQEDDFAYQFAMSPDSKSMIVLLEREVFNVDV
jgi:hypothetical protein